MLKPLIFNYFSKKKLTILLFHKVPKDFNPLESSELDINEFEKILEGIQKIFRILPLEDAMLALKNGNLPTGSACITFDDGYIDWVNGVVPVLEKKQAHATFFITTGQFSGQALWNERILYSISKTKKNFLFFKDFGLPEFILASTAQRESAILQLNSFVKYQSPEIKEAIIKEIEHQANVSSARVPVMSKHDARLLHSKGFGIGAHSITHPILSRCDHKLAYREIANSREELMSLIGAKINLFAYPNGIPGKDFGLEHAAMLKKAGYFYGFTTSSGVATQQTSCWEIPRFTPWSKSRLGVNWQFARNFYRAPYLLKKNVEINKNVLMIAFHFPPQSGSSGIQRTLNFVKYLPLYGWKPTVLTTHPRAYLERSDDLLKEIPSNVKVFRAFAMDAAKHFAIKRKYPGVLAIPDRWSVWWFGGVFNGLKAIKRENPSILWSTYPIATAHMIGATLNRITGIPWVADFRDPMINGNYPSHKLQRKSWKWIESRAMNSAARCVFTTERSAQFYKEKYPSAAHKCIVIENGYNEEIFYDIKNCLFDKNKEIILMLHSGIIYPGDRDPACFLLAIKYFLDKNLIDRKNIIIRFRASQHEKEILTLVKNLKMEDVIEICPSIEYAKAIAEMQSANLLLVFQGKNFNTQIPAKIYEYIRSGRSIMAMVDLEGDTAKRLKEFDGVYIADINSVEEIKNQILLWLNQRHSKNAIIAMESNFLKIKKFSRKKQTYLLNYIFRSVEK